MAPDRRNKIRHERDILRFVLVYAGVSALWIAFSDEVVAVLFTNPATATLVSIAKGWFFVAATAVVMYVLMQRMFAVTMRLNADLGATLGAIPDRFFEVDADGVYCNVWVDSPRWLGKGVVQHGHNICDFLLYEAAETVKAALAEAARTGKSTGQVIEVDAVEGHRWYELSVVRKAVAVDTAMRLVVFLRDVTERVAGESALRETEARYRKLFENNSVAMLFIEPKGGQIVDANPAAISFYGYSRESLIGMSIDAINTLPPERVAAQRERARLHQDKIFFFSHRLAGGEIRDVEVHVSPIESGGRTLLFSIVYDITERKQLEERLGKLSLAVEQSPESIVITDLEARIEYVNDAFVRKTGYTLEEVSGQNPRILNSGKTPLASYTALWEALTAGHEWRGEFHNRRKDGSEYIEFASVAPLRSSDGRITHYVAVKEDISERRRLEDELDLARQRELGKA